MKMDLSAIEPILNSLTNQNASVSNFAFLSSEQIPSIAELGDLADVA